MFTGTVQRVKRGFWGPKYVTVYQGVDVYPEPILRELAKYDDRTHRKSFHDYTESHGDFRDPARGVTVYERGETPDDVDADGFCASTGRTFVVEPIDDDMPF